MSVVHSREVLRTYDRKDVTNVNDEAAGPKGLPTRVFLQRWL